MSVYSYTFYVLFYYSLTTRIQVMSCHYQIKIQLLSICTRLLDQHEITRSIQACGQEHIMIDGSWYSM